MRHNIDTVLNTILSSILKVVSWDVKHESIVIDSRKQSEASRIIFLTNKLNKAKVLFIDAD